MERLKVKARADSGPGSRGRRLIVLTVDGETEIETGLTFRTNHTWGTMLMDGFLSEVNGELARQRGHRWYERHIPKVAAMKDTHPCDERLYRMKYALRMRLLARESRA